MILLGLLFSTASSYILVEQAKKWAEAEEYCQLEYGSHLATIRNDEDAKELFNMIVPGAPYGEVWIGLNDLETEGHWIYTDGTGCPTADHSCGRDVFTYWCTDIPPDVQPNGGTDQNCAQIVTDATYWTDLPVTWDSMLNDWWCVSNLDSNLYFVCNDPEPCVAAGRDLGREHHCTCRSSCDSADRFCNSYEFVFSVVGGRLSPDASLCPGIVNPVCCCSCPNCPNFVSL